MSHIIPSSGIVDRRTLLKAGAFGAALLGVGMTPLQRQPASLGMSMPALRTGITLTKGSSGPEVTELQRLLRGNYRQMFFGQSPTGSFYDVTWWALVNWQTASPYSPTGTIVVGSEQWNMLARECFTYETDRLRYQGRYISHFPTTSVWYKGPAALISLTDMRAYFTLNGRVQRSTRIRTGRPGKQTLPGTTRVLWKVYDDVSREYGNTPMPRSVYFWSNGSAFHYSSDFAYNGYANMSHGCANIPTLEMATWIYNFLPVGAPVVVYWGGTVVNCYGAF